MAFWKVTTVAVLATLMLAESASAQATSGSTYKAAYKGRKASLVTGDEMVKAAQQALKDKGHDPGTVDGRMGPKTQAALREFQKAQGMESTGELDAKTTGALGMDGQTSSEGASSTAGSASPATPDVRAPSGAADQTQADEKK